MSEHPDPLGLMTDLVAFEVETSGYYLVPLAALSGYRVPPRAGGAASDTAGTGWPGWGWQLPVVRWNTSHASQIHTEIALAPHVVARLDPRRDRSARRRRRAVGEGATRCRPAACSGRRKLGAARPSR